MRCSWERGVTMKWWHHFYRPLSTEEPRREATVFDLPEDHPLRIAHKKSLFNRAEIEASQQCGCFYCKEIFGPDRIVDWADPKKPHAQQTAVCPECGIDSVIGNASGFEITEAFLEEMRVAWFSVIAP